tara:strand:- start:32284 stop:34506 length:2223 start_codon:yes stop_codon:yes gene_type:complete
MKLVFFTQDSEIEELVDMISGADVILTDTLDGLEAEIEDDRCLFFIDFDFDKKHAEQVNQELYDHGNVRRVILSSGMRIKDLKKHQKGKFAAHGYLVKPLSLEIVNGVLNDYELSDYLIDHQLDDTDESALDDVELSDIGGKAPAIKEFTFNPEVRAEIDKHSSAKANPELDSELNLEIQAKFDDVFGSASSGDTQSFDEFSDLGEDDYNPDSSLGMADEVDDIPTLQVDFGNNDEDMTAGFKAGLSPEDGTGEFELDSDELAAISDESTEEVAMSSDDDLDLDETDLEFDDEEAELEEGALEFDSGEDGDLDLGDDSQESDGLEFGSSELESPSESDDEDDVSISLGADDLELGDDTDMDLDLGAEAAVSASSDMDLDEADDFELDLGASEESEASDDDELDLGEETNPTIVATTQQLDADSLNLEEEDLAEFSAVSDNATATATDSLLEENSDDEDDGFSLDDGGELDEDDLSFDVSSDDDIDDELTAATTIAPMSDPKEFSYDQEESATSEHFRAAKTAEEPLPKGQVLSSLDQPDLLRLQATIKQLREERSGLIEQMDDLKGSVRILQQDKLTLKAELEESRIEISILKKRHIEESEETKHRTRVLEERKAFFEEKAKTLQKEFDRLSQKIRIDFNKVKQREKELESQLELVTMDTQSQVKSRDMKILELKRKIDSLEFNMENATIREQKSREDKQKLEDRLGKMMKTLRGSIKLLEDDIDLDEETRAQIEKARKL